MDQSAGLMRNAGGTAAEKRSYRVHLGFGIEAVRLRRQLTRKTLASRLGMTAKLLGYWERGSCRPPIEKLVDLCRVLRVTVEDLLAAGETREAYLLRGHEDPGGSERRSDMSEETSGSVPGPGSEPGVIPIEPDLKSERLQEEATSPIPPEPGPVQAAG
jgi:transcriptional regulator with XRE-family HTH domain